MKYGEIIQLGRHRLICGDATNRDDVMRLIGDDRVDLVLTDPPYGMKCQHKDGAVGGGGSIKMRKIRDDIPIYHPQQFPLLVGNNSADTARKHYSIAKHLTDKLIIWGGQYFADFLPVNGGWLFWDKLTGGNTDFSDGELAWCSVGKKLRKYSQKWNGIIRQGNFTLNLKRRVHPTQKPVELHMHILEDFSQPGDVILDCFGGSGTTLIACEITGRTCLMMEISPDYCSIIANRFNTLTQGTINFSGAIS